MDAIDITLKGQLVIAADEFIASLLVETRCNPDALRARGLECIADVMADLWAGTGLNDPTSKARTMARSIENDLRDASDRERRETWRALDRLSYAAEVRAELARRGIRES